MRENRKLKRYSVKLKVYSQQSGKIIGYIEDINISGMNIKSTARFPDMQEVKVWFGVDSYNKSEKIDLTVIKVWDAFTDTTPRFYNTGLHYINPDEDALDLLQEMIFELRDEYVTQRNGSSYI
jgi:hypothetical protein